MFERCKYANECNAQCSGAIENSETCDSFQLHQSLEQAVNQYNQVVKQNKGLQAELTQNKIAELKAENERLKEKIKMYKSEDTRKHNVIMETLQYEKKALDVSIKYKQTLQEIKAIVCGNYEIIDTQGRKDIIKLITKAEEEWNT